MAKRLEELPVYSKVRAFEDAVDAILERPVCGRNRKLRDQIDSATESVLANMSEGFEQSTDAHLAKYLYTSKGSVAEAVDHLRRACRRRWITKAEYAQFAAMGAEIGRMLGGWINYLARCDFKDRGRRMKDRDPDRDSDRDPYPDGDSDGDSGRD
jgi:four helix bundle protein